MCRVRLLKHVCVLQLYAEWTPDPITQVGRARSHRVRRMVRRGTVVVLCGPWCGWGAAAESAGATATRETVVSRLSLGGCCWDAQEGHCTLGPLPLACARPLPITARDHRHIPSRSAPRLSHTARKHLQGGARRRSSGILGGLASLTNFSEKSHSPP